MVTDKLKELEAAKAKMADLVKAVEAERNKELKTLPEKYGFDNVGDFINALRAAAGGRTGKRGTKRRRRAVITDETRAQVKKLVAGGKTGAEIADSLGISRQACRISRRRWAW